MGIRETVTSDGFSKYHVRCVICGRTEEVFPVDYINDPIEWTHNLKFKKCKSCRIEENNKKLNATAYKLKLDNYVKEFNETIKWNSISTTKQDTFIPDTIPDTTKGLGLVPVEKGRKLKDII